MLDSPDCNLKGMNWGVACLETGYSPKGNFTNQFRDHNGLGEGGVSPAGLVLAPRAIIASAARYDRAEEEMRSWCAGG